MSPAEAIGIVLAAIGILLGYFVVTGDTVKRWQIRRKITRLPEEFVRLAEAYKLADLIADNSTESVVRPSWYDRVRQKDILAEGLYRFAQGANIDRNVLASSQEDGYVIALAKIIIAAPRAGDGILLAKAAKCKVPPHVDYRLLEAVESLARNGLVSLVERNEVNEAVDRIGDRLGEEATARVAAVRGILRSAPERHKISF